MASYLNTNYLKHKLLAVERLKPATELKLVSRGNEFHAFTTRSLKKIDLAQVLLRLLTNSRQRIIHMTWLVIVCVGHILHILLTLFLIKFGKYFFRCRIFNPVNNDFLRTLTLAL